MRHSTQQVVQVCQPRPGAWQGLCVERRNTVSHSPLFLTQSCSCSSHPVLFQLSGRGSNNNISTRLAVNRDKPRNLKLELCICSWDFIYGLGKTQYYQLNQFLSLRLLKPFFDNVLLELGGLPHVFPLAVRLEWLGTHSWHSGVLRVSIWTVAH